MPCVVNQEDEVGESWATWPLKPQTDDQLEGIIFVRGEYAVEDDWTVQSYRWCVGWLNREDANVAIAWQLKKLRVVPGICPESFSRRAFRTLKHCTSK